MPGLQSGPGAPFPATGGSIHWQINTNFLGAQGLLGFPVDHGDLVNS